MKNYLVTAAVCAACLASSVFAEDQSNGQTEFLISGPLERVDGALETVTVFGRDFVTGNASDLAPGEIVNIYGSLQPDGSIANAVVESTAQFGSGADAVYLKGVVTGVDGALGQIQVGETTVDYTQQLANSEFSAPSIGQVIAVEGTQPLVKGVVLASAMGSSLVARSSVPGRSISTFSTQGGGITHLSTQGGGLISLSTQGGGIAHLSTQGGGVSSLSTQGGGVASLSTQGGGIAHLSTQGGGVSSLSTQGGGIGSLSTQGGGVASLSTQGGGIASLSTQGGGVSS
jgi:hypothetical protein